MREHSVVGSDGVEHEVDAIIFGTGFHVTDAFDYLDIIGRDGRDLAKEWASEGMRTHYGIAVAGFPNLFFLLGPNTGLGHNSVVFMIESQIRYVADAIGWSPANRAERDRGARRRAGAVQRGDPAQAGERRVDAGRLHELVPGREGREPDHLAGVHLAVLAGHASGCEPADFDSAEAHGRSRVAV